jgi:hypothetical protein
VFQGVKQVYPRCESKFLLIHTLSHTLVAVKKKQFGILIRITSAQVDYMDFDIATITPQSVA